MTKGYNVGFGYMGMVDGEYTMFASEADYIEYVEEKERKELDEYVEKNFLDYPWLPYPVAEGSAIQIEDVVVLDYEERILLFCYNVMTTKLRLLPDGSLEEIAEDDGNPPFVF